MQYCYNTVKQHSSNAAGTRHPRRNARSRSTLEWWRESEAHGEVADQALACPQAATEAGRQWPPGRQPEIAEPEPDRHGERAAPVDELQARANDAAARTEAQQAQQDASNQYTARMAREAQAEPEVGWQAAAPDEIEMELQ